MFGDDLYNALTTALNQWNSKIDDIISLLTKTPEQFKPEVWTVIQNVFGSMQAVGYALLILFFSIGIVKTAGSLTDLKRPEVAIKMFIRFLLTKLAMDNLMTGMNKCIDIGKSLILTINERAGIQITNLSVPDSVKTAIKDLKWTNGLFMAIVALLGALVIMVLSIVVVLTVYGRFFKIFLYTAVSPLPISSFAGAPTAQVGKSFIKAYAGVVLEGVIIVLACVIYAAYATSTPVINPSASSSTIVWQYIGETVLSMLIFVGIVKMSDRVVKEVMNI